MTTVSKPYAGQTLRLSHGLILQADKEMTDIAALLKLRSYLLLGSTLESWPGTTAYCTMHGNIRRSC